MRVDKMLVTSVLLITGAYGLSNIRNVPRTIDQFDLSRALLGDITSPTREPSPPLCRSGLQPWSGEVVIPGQGRKIDAGCRDTCPQTSASYGVREDGTGYPVVNCQTGPSAAATLQALDALYR